jgi:DNA polymerase-3 subunit alpha
MAKPTQIADRIKELGFGACAVTDHDVVAGHVDFYNTLTAEGIKPILGIECYQAPETRWEKPKAIRNKETGERADNYHLVLLAKNNTGLRNLWALNTQSHEEGFWRNGRVDWELLDKYKDGLIATSACGLSLLGWAIQHGDPNPVIRNFQKIFGDNFFIELHTYQEDWQRELNVELLDLSMQYSIPVVYANDAHYAREEDHDYHEALIALAMNKKLKDEDRMSHTPDLFIMDEEQIADRLGYLGAQTVERAIANSDFIADQCNVTLPGRKKRTPLFVPDAQYATGKDMLYDLAVDGYMRKIAAYDKPNDIYMERFEKEINVIFDADLVDYFLIVHDYIKWAKNEGILVGPGRGSAGGSLIAYLLGITELDPIRYGLIFERFYNAGRETGLPDIDTDFPVKDRDRVFQYIVNKYGKDYVANLATIGQMQPKMGVKDMGRVLGVNMRDTEKIGQILDQSIKQGLQARDWSEVLDGTDEAEGLREVLTPWMEKYPELFDYAQKFHHQIRTYGVHASGVIIGDEPLAENFPLKWNANQEKMVAQFDMGIAEDFGYMKADLLGLRNLDTLDEFNRILAEEGRETIDFEALQYNELDPRVWKLLQDGLTVGIFQIESATMAKQIVKELKPESIDDLAAVVSMNRPGPMLAGALEKYVHGKNGGEVHYPHPYLAEPLEPTYGTFLYQEQVIEYLGKIGYNLLEADDVRSIMGKKKVEKVVVERERYMPYAMNHMDEMTAAEIWTQLVNFSRYGFNKSHAIAYALILYWTAYAKVYDPTVFTLAAIRTVDKDALPRYIQEAQRMGIDILPPDVNRSEEQISKSGDSILYGFQNIKGFGAGPARWITEHQPYDSPEEFLAKAQEFKYTLPNGQKRVQVNVGQLEKLIALGSFGKDAEYQHKIKKDTFKEMRPAEDLELLELEEELLGVALSDESATILEDHREIIEKLCVEFDELDEDGEYNVAGVVSEYRESKTKKGQAMTFIKIENGPHTMEIAVWSDVRKRLEFIFRRRQAGIFQVKKTNRGTSLLNARALFKRTVNETTRAA